MRRDVSERVLVCDPSPQAQRALRVTLRNAGYEVMTATTAAQALDLTRAAQPRAVIVEWVLPDLTGRDLCRRLRLLGDMPILVASTVDDAQATISALESGADDYVTKPFRPGEVVARLAARLRAAPSHLRVMADGVVVDLTTHLATVDGHEVHLTAREFAILRVLATSPGTVAYEAIVGAVWGELRGDPMPRIRTHVANLRAKLDPGQSRGLIETQCGIGYRFRPRTASGVDRPGGIPA
jgi:two-component system, OmpR family, KDP operon response regulator KdpE